MATKLKVKKGDTVQVIAGADKGKKGSVIAIDKSKLRVKVEGVRVQTHFDKKDGLKKLEGYLDYSNVQLVESKAKDKKTSKKKASKTV
ncbi:MAG: KOW motif-containing protein [Proteobacteria bacterium]|nr:KOW motif-containing protein [Pseudomonadota bacterium]